MASRGVFGVQRLRRVSLRGDTPRSTRGSINAVRTRSSAGETRQLRLWKRSAPCFQGRVGTSVRLSSSDGDDRAVSEAEDLSAAGSPGQIDIASGQGQDVDLLIVAALFLVPAVGGLLFGYDIGATSGALVGLTSPTVSGISWYGLSSFQSGLIVSLSLFGALVGSVGAFFIGDKLGRRKELLLSAGLYGAGALISSLSPSYGIMTIGRMLYGLGIGFAMHAAPAYIAETAPSKWRGLLISLKEAFIVGGILLGYLASYLLVDAVGGWRGMYGIAVPLALTLFGGALWMPESARWLLLSGAGKEPAREALVRTKGKISNLEKVVDDELQSMMETVALEGSEGSTGDFSKLFVPKNLRPLLVGMSLMFFQQITGQPSVLYYAASIFQKAGFATESAATGVSIILGVFKLVMTSIAALFVDSWGRRPLLLLGVSNLVVALLVLSGIAFAPPGDLASWLVWGNVGALLLYVGAYQVSFGPISWLLVGELFPLEVRGPAVALATFVNFGTNFVVSWAFPILQEAVGLGSTYLVFAGIGAAAVLSIYFTVPETKGKTLEEIEKLWTS